MAQWTGISYGSSDGLATYCKLDPPSEQISVKFEAKFEYIYIYIYTYRRKYDLKKSYATWLSLFFSITGSFRHFYV